MLAQCKLDYSYFFRKLSDIHQPQVHTEIRNLCLDIAAFDDWYSQYQLALIIDGQPNSSEQAQKRKQQMNQVNPKYILRNYLAQNAISKAQQGDYNEVKTLHKILSNPFDEHKEFEEYAQLPADWGKKIEISCSS